MEMDMVADMEVDKLVDMVANMVVDEVAYRTFLESSGQLSIASAARRSVNIRRLSVGEREYKYITQQFGLLQTHPCYFEPPHLHNNDR